jgi:hypothetical protein
MRLRPFLLAVLLSLAASLASATPQLRNATGLWQNADESGWGLSLFHQGDTLFGALFVYGSDGRPRWYVASNLVGNDDGPLHDRGTTYTGALYEATGPAFAGAFDPAKVARREVGIMRFQIGDNGGTVDYTVDGVSVSKQVRPFTFRTMDLSGRYVGYLVQPPTAAGGEIRNLVEWTIQQSGAGVHIAQTNGTCTYDGTYGQNGQVATVSGTYSGCGTGNFTMAVDPTPDGLTGAFTGNGITAPWGRIALSRRDAGVQEGNGWRTDLWFPPAESGWGLNVVEQGDTIFATMFVYDAQGASHWFVASALTRSPPRADGTSAFSGPLYEATGPYFATPFNANAVTRRQVGTMTFDVRDASTARLDYTVDGVSVTKTVSRYAFRKNNLGGDYVGHVAASQDNPGGANQEAVTISIDDGDAGFVMRTQPQGPTQTRSAASCTFTGPSAPVQSGEQRSISGSYACANGDRGSFTMQNVLPTFHGITASFQGAWVVAGHIEGVRLVTTPVVPPPTAPTKFSFVSNAVARPNGEATVSVQRIGSSSGAYVVNYAFSGSACASRVEGGSVTFGEGDTSNKSITVPMGASGQCDVVLVSVTAPAELDKPRTATVTVVPPIAGCATPTNVVTNTLTGVGNPLIQRQASGVTVFMTLPSTLPGRTSGSIVFSESAGSAYTPQPVTLEISINKCPGIIETDPGNFCNLRTTNGNFNSITFVSQASPGIDRNTANQRGYCWAGDGGQYYINARWTYSACASGMETCGFAIQFNDGPF